MERLYERRESRRLPSTRLSGNEGDVRWRAQPDVVEDLVMIRSGS
jgi:hypothetical protein